MWLASSFLARPAFRPGGRMHVMIVLDVNMGPTVRTRYRISTLERLNRVGCLARDRTLASGRRTLEPSEVIGSAAGLLTPAAMGGGIPFSPRGPILMQHPDGAYGLFTGQATSPARIRRAARPSRGASGGVVQMAGGRRLPRGSTTRDPARCRFEAKSSEEPRTSSYSQAMMAVGGRPGQGRRSRAWRRRTPSPPVRPRSFPRSAGSPPG